MRQPTNNIGAGLVPAPTYLPAPCLLEFASQLGAISSRLQRGRGLGSRTGARRPDTCLNGSEFIPPKGVGWECASR